MLTSTIFSILLFFAVFYSSEQQQQQKQEEYSNVQAEWLPGSGGAIFYVEPENEGKNSLLRAIRSTLEKQGTKQRFFPYYKGLGKK